MKAQQRVARRWDDARETRQALHPCYAFQPGNDVREYAAELAVRYFREQSAMLAKKPLAKPAFKCGPQENALAFRLFVDEFFDGVDRTPACP
ncbi:MAG: hypothetical protein HOO96_07045 [Polyangiaceae bacterium]|nr:hypothetical protein [Polyangiaceae bacterium]